MNYLVLYLVQLYNVFLFSETYGPRIPGTEPVDTSANAYASQPSVSGAPQAYYSAPPQAASIPMPGAPGAFNNQLPNMYMQPPMPPMTAPQHGVPAPGTVDGVRKAEGEAEGQTDAKRARLDNTQQNEADWTPPTVCVLVKRCKGLSMTNSSFLYSPLFPSTLLLQTCPISQNGTLMVKRLLFLIYHSIRSCQPSKIALHHS